MSSTRKVKRKRRKLRKGFIVFLIILFILLSFGIYSLVNSIVNANRKIKYNANINYDNAETLDIDLYSKEYLLIRLNDYEVLYGKDIDLRIYPASITKVMTLATVLRLCENLDDTSYVTSEQVDELIVANASLAYIQRDYDYPIRDLLYALILPSGADGAKALENYFENKGINLIDEMNVTSELLKLEDSHFTNTTGLHNDNHYTTINDILKVYLYALRFDEGKKVLEASSYKMIDDKILHSYIAYASSMIDKAEILGGKTGYTPDAGLCISIIFRNDSRSYLLITTGAPGKPVDGNHFMDCKSIIDYMNSNK